jgi:cob(I)alamin adenosyltransferase
MKKVHLGDKGETSLIGKRVQKTNLRVHAVGSIDELNSFIGLCRSLSKEKKFFDFDSLLEKIQEKLFVVGSELAAVTGKSKIQIKKSDVDELDKQTREYEKMLPELKSFILPSGSELASLLHIARSVCRRAEREIVALMKKEKINELILVYLNRLSDLLFTMARLANKRENVMEKEWIT